MFDVRCSSGSPGTGVGPGSDRRSVRARAPRHTLDAAEQSLTFAPCLAQCCSLARTAVMNRDDHRCRLLLVAAPISLLCGVLSPAAQSFRYSCSRSAKTFGLLDVLRLRCSSKAHGRNECQQRRHPIRLLRLRVAADVANERLRQRPDNTTDRGAKGHWTRGCAQKFSVPLARNTDYGQNAGKRYPARRDQSADWIGLVAGQLPVISCMA
jgi:hypothetical protein